MKQKTVILNARVIHVCFRDINTKSNYYWCIRRGFSKECIKEEWTLQQLEDHERRTEAAAIGAAALTDNSHVKISKIAGK